MTDKPLKRPRGPAQLAKLMIDIASGEVEDRDPTPEEQGKDTVHNDGRPHAQTDSLARSRPCCRGLAPRLYRHARVDPAHRRQLWTLPAHSGGRLRHSVRARTGKYRGYGWLGRRTRIRGNQRRRDVRFRGSVVRFEST